MVELTGKHARGSSSSARGTRSTGFVIGQIIINFWKIGSPSCEPHVHQASILHRVWSFEWLASITKVERTDVWSRNFLGA